MNVGPYASAKTMKRNLCRAKRTDGCDSAREARRKFDLMCAEKRGEIQGLVFQCPFRLGVNGIEICTYVADFVYWKDGKQIVEDCKGVIMPAYKIKKKLMLAIYNIDILET